MQQSALGEPAATVPNKAGRQAIRTRETRDLLMRAAKTVFARDGYEGADLMDIAVLADRTKGAIYGQFKSKEEIFLALMSDHCREYRVKLEQFITSDIKHNVAVVRQFILNLCEDDDWALLHLEFKLFALRHPAAKERLRHFCGPLDSNTEELYTRLLGPAGKTKRSVSRSMALHSIILMLSALVLEARSQQGPMNKNAIKNLIGSVFDALIGE